MTTTTRMLPAAAAGLLLCSCSNPLASSPSDYGERMPAERLRRIELAEIDRFAKPVDAPRETPEDPVEEARKKFEGVEKIDLSLEQCRASALERNLDLKVALVDPTITAERVRQEEAKFESAFTVRGLWQETDSPTSSELDSAQARFQSLEPGITIPLRTGGTAVVSLPMSRNENDNEFSTLNPAYTSDLQFSLSQPLLRNAGRYVSTHSIKIASYNLQISEAQTKLAIIQQLAAVDRAYWRLYAARRALEVAQQQYELATEQLRKAERQVRAGNQPEIEVTRAQSGVANRIEAIINAQNEILFQQRELKRVINEPGLDVDTPVNVVTTTEPNPVEYLMDREALMASAIDGRMEMMELELRLLADAANIRFAENQKLPQLDLTATYRINGLGESENDSFHNLGRNHFEDWSIGAFASVPLGNEAAKSRLREAVLTRLQRLNSRESRRQTIRQEVLDAVDGINAGWQRILASRIASILSGRTLQAEQHQFDVGTSTSTAVLDAATRYALAQLDEIRAVVDYQVAQIDLAVATGTSLGASRVEWDPLDPSEDSPEPPIEETPGSAQ